MDSKAAHIDESHLRQPHGGFLVAKRGEVCYTMPDEKKRDYRVATLVIPTPTPEWPRRQAWVYDSTKPLPGQVGGGFLVAREGLLGNWKSYHGGTCQPVTTRRRDK